MQPESYEKKIRKCVHAVRPSTTVFIHDKKHECYIHGPFAGGQSYDAKTPITAARLVQLV